MPWKRVDLCVDYSVRSLCQRTYPGHLHGCPNFFQKDTCPPRRPHINHLINLDKHAWVVWNAFNMARHIKRMRKRHPDWSLRQLVCCLYWQGGARKALREEVYLFRSHFIRPLPIVWIPEATGVNVTETMRRIGIELEWPPLQTAYQVAVVGYPLK